MSKIIGVLDYGLGNIGNVINCLNLANDGKYKIKLVKDDEISHCDKLVLPGVGAFRCAMDNMQNYKDSVLDFAKSGKFLLGICLGMQILFEKSYEFGEHEGLGLLKGEIVGFANNENFDKKLKIPHVGWNKVEIKHNHKILKDIGCELYLYFVHSFYAKCDEKIITASADYSISFPAIVSFENIIGIQPHPEKSHKIGFQIMKNFIDL